MNVLTLKIPEDLAAALPAASRVRGLSKSAVVREALEQSLARHAQQAGTAERWVAQWRGRLSALPASRASKRKATAAGGLRGQSVAQAAGRDARLSHLLAKHLR